MDQWHEYITAVAMDSAPYMYITIDTTFCYLLFFLDRILKRQLAEIV